MEMGIFTCIGSFWMVASQHPMRMGLTQIGLRPLVASYSQLPYSKPFKNISAADVFAFSCSSISKSTRFARQLSTLVCF